MIIILIASLVFFVACTVKLFVLNNIVASSRFTKAVVTKITDNSVCYSFDCFSESFNGFVTRYSFPKSDNKYKLGDKIGIYYRIDNPKNNVAEDEIAADSNLFLITALLAICEILVSIIERYNYFASRLFVYSLPLFALALLL